MAPPDAKDAPDYARALRLAAAQGGYDYVLCCWGVLEAEQKNLPSKGVSWVPVLGRSVPDQSQRMRLRLKAVLLDARTGRWVMVAPPPAESDAASNRSNRAQTDQSQVQKLKEEGYKALIEELIKTAG